MSLTYHIRGDGLSITCLVCCRTSNNANDVREIYCGGCSRWHSRPFAVGCAARVRVAGHAGWVGGIVNIASANNQRLTLTVAEGLPLRAAGLRPGEQVLLLTWLPGGHWQEVISGEKFDCEADYEKTPA